MKQSALLILIVLLILGCTKQPSADISNENIEKLEPKESIECKNEISRPLGGIIENYVGMEEGKSKNLTYIFYSGSEEGRLNVSIHRVLNFFKTEYKKIPAGLEVRIEPSEINVKPNHTYKLNVNLRSSDMPGVYYESYDGGKIKSEKFVFLVQAKIKNKTINDWFEVEINPAGNIVIPGKSHLIACSIPEIEYSNSIAVRKGKNFQTLLKFYPRKSIPGVVNVTVFRVTDVHEFERLNSGGISVDVEPSCFLPESKPVCMTCNSSTIRVNTTPAVTPGKYVFCILVDYNGGILTANWLTVRVNLEMQAVTYSGTRIEYPGSSTKITLPNTSGFLYPAPYPVFGRIPEPGAKDVPLGTNISMSFPRPPSILKLEIEPEVSISHVKQELIMYTGKYTFYLAKPLKPGTEYNITITAGQEKPPGLNISPLVTESWNFTTVNPEINITPEPGEYFTCGGVKPEKGNETRILLVNAELEYDFLKAEEICPPDRANVGDLGIVINGTIKNEYDVGYHVCLAARAYNSEGERIGSSIDSGAVCGVISPYVESRKTENFKLHLKYSEDIKRIEIIVGCVSQVPPP